MIRGFYTAASGLLTQERNLAVYSNNMANSATAGYKKDRLITTTFQQELVMRLEKGNPENFGSFDIIRHPEELETSLQQSSLEVTQRPYDMAIMGEGFFVVKTPQGEELLTRNGQFDIDEKGFLILRGVGKVQSTKGDVKLESSDFTIGTRGEINKQGKNSGTLKIVQPEDPTTLSNAFHGVMRDSNPLGWKQVKEDIEVTSGAYERSNVDLAEEMTRVMESSRSFQSCSQMVKMIDASESKLLESMGKGQ